MKTAIGTAMIEAMAHYGVYTVMWGDAAVLDRAFFNSGTNSVRDYPPDRWSIVLNALTRDARFENDYLSIDVPFTGRPRRRTVRMFRLKLVPESEATDVHAN